MPDILESVNDGAMLLLNANEIIEAYKIAIKRCIELCDRQGMNSKQLIKSILIELIKEPTHEQNPRTE